MWKVGILYILVLQLRKEDGTSRQGWAGPLGLRDSEAAGISPVFYRGLPVRLAVNRSRYVGEGYIVGQNQGTSTSTGRNVEKPGSVLTVSSLQVYTYWTPYLGFKNMDNAENDARMLRGELYHAFVPSLVVRRNRCHNACDRFNKAGEMSRRRQVELWKEYVESCFNR